MNFVRRVPDSTQGVAIGEVSFDIPSQAMVVVHISQQLRKISDDPSSRYLIFSPLISCLGSFKGNLKGSGFVFSFETSLNAHARVGRCSVRTKRMSF